MYKQLLKSIAFIALINGTLSSALHAYDPQLCAECQESPLDCDAYPYACLTCDVACAVGSEEKDRVKNPTPTNENLKSSKKDIS